MTKNGVYLVLAFTLVTLLSGCPRQVNKKNAPKKSSPATVENAVKETQLTTLKISAQAEARLGLKSVLVKLEQIKRTRRLGGTIVLPPGHISTMFAPFTGRINTCSPKGLTAGQSVKKGEIILHLSVFPDKGEVFSAHVKAASAHERLKLARIKAQRACRLTEEESGTQEEYEQAQAEVLKIEAELKVARAYQEFMKNSRPPVTVSFDLEIPHNGIIQNIHVNNGQHVIAGTPLLVIRRQQPLWVKVPVYAGDLKKFDLSRGAKIYGLNDPPESTGITVKTIAAPPYGDPDAASIDLYFELDNQEKIWHPGQKILAALLLQDTKEQMTIPWSSVLYDMYGNTWVYEKIKPLIYKRRRIELYDVVNDRALIARGLKPETQVIGTGATELFGTEFGAGK